ncbi:hypothetical protein [Catenulispora pinisilvae]|uniref:hypothetical protein n=1 Tax=Catenulispora pinisilvae TaxID=2705253 RepID=UPI001890C924|nr:hypothetical protein [Catenulispora pinisilvae]
MSTAKTWAGRAVNGRPHTTAAANVTARPKTRTSESERLMQQGLSLAGSLLMPLGLLAIGLGWYGAAHTPYTFEQVSYLVSGGIGGLALTTLGGFLFFGSWLARIAHQQRQQTELLAAEIARLADAILTLESGD